MLDGSFEELVKAKLVFVLIVPGLWKTKVACLNYVGYGGDQKGKIENDHPWKAGNIILF